MRSLSESYNKTMNKLPAHMRRAFAFLSALILFTGVLSTVKVSAEDISESTESVYSSIDWTDTVGGDAYVSLSYNGQHYAAEQGQTVLSGTEVTVWVNPDRGYVLAAIKINEIDCDFSGVSYTFTMPDHPVHIEVAFKSALMINEMDAEIITPDSEAGNDYLNALYQLKNITFYDYFGNSYPLDNIASIEEMYLETSYGEKVLNGDLKSGYSYKTFIRIRLNENGLKYFVMDFKYLILPSSMDNWKISGGNYSEVILESPLVTLPGTALYSVDAVSVDGGRLYLEKFEAAPGDTVSVIIVPDDHYEFDKWVIEGGYLPEFTHNGQALLFTMPEHPVSLHPAFAKKKETATNPSEATRHEEIGQRNHYSDQTTSDKVNEPGVITDLNAEEDGMHLFSSATVWYIVVIVLVVILAIFVISFVRRHRDQFV